MALQLNIETLERRSFRDTILELLTNEQYKERARMRSNSFKDQPESPLERALWWIDYVQRNPDMSFLQSQRLSEMNYVAKHSIDVVVFLAVVLLFVILIAFKFLRFVLEFNKNGHLTASSKMKLS